MSFFLLLFFFSVCLKIEIFSMLCQFAIFAFSKQTKKRLFLRRNASSRICYRWNSVFSPWTAPEPSSYYRADRLPDVIVGEAPQAHYSSTPLHQPPEAVITLLLQWQSRRLRWSMVRLDRRRCFHWARFSEGRYGCNANSGLIASYSPDLSFPYTDRFYQHHYHHHRGGNYHHHQHCEGKGVTTILGTM